MKILRAGLDDTDLFSEEQLNNGACCFYTEDKASKYFFQITGREAVLFGDSGYINETIDEFLFYSGFISCIKNPDGAVLRKNPELKIQLCEILKIQPSQFYINERKLNNCKKQIKSGADIIVPVTVKNEEIIALDGHTRMRAALDLGINSVYIYPDDNGEYIDYFVKEAKQRGIFSISQMEIISNEEYKQKWHKFCDDYFNNKS